MRGRYTASVTRKVHLDHVCGVTLHGNKATSTSTHPRLWWYAHLYLILSTVLLNVLRALISYQEKHATVRAKCTTYDIVYVLQRPVSSIYRMTKHMKANPCEARRPQVHFPWTAATREINTINAQNKKQFPHHVVSLHFTFDTRTLMCECIHTLPYGHRWVL